MSQVAIEHYKKLSEVVDGMRQKIGETKGFVVTIAGVRVDVSYDDRHTQMEAVYLAVGKLLAFPQEEAERLRTLKKRLKAA